MAKKASSTRRRQTEVCRAYTRCSSAAARVRSTDASLGCRIYLREMAHRGKLPGVQLQPVGHGD